MKLRNKEDKRYWYIDVDGEVMSKEMAWFNQQQDDIGNRFETKEEAEKAVEKLKAWERLKDKGFRFDGWKNETQAIKYNFGGVAWHTKELESDLDLLFCTEVKNDKVSI